MSSFPLTNSIIFQDGYCTTNQVKHWPLLLVLTHSSGAAIGSGGTSDPCRGVAGLSRRLRRGTTGVKVSWEQGNPPGKKGIPANVYGPYGFIMFYLKLAMQLYITRSLLLDHCSVLVFNGHFGGAKCGSYHQIPSGRRRLLRLLWWWEGRQGQQGQQGWGALDWVWNCLEYVGVHKSGETHLSNCWTDYSNYGAP